MHRFIKLFLAVTVIFGHNLAHADKAFVQRQDVQIFINNMVTQHGFNRQQLTEIMDDVNIQPQIIESMDKPFEKKTWDVYKALFLTPERVQGGIDFWKTNEEILTKAEQHYGVPANIIVAIIGVETLYGKNQGNYRVIDALSTLAFNYPKRSPFFTKELEEFLILCREHQVAANEYMGSYAGAMGKAQFMPSSYRHFAEDFTENPKKDLMNDNTAVIASIGNYLQHHGFKINEGIAQPAKVTGNAIKRINVDAKKATYSMQQLAHAGVRPMTAAVNPSKKVGLIELITQSGKEYWMAYPNFYVITRYNTSPQYALAVYLLAQQLKTQKTAATPGKQYALA